MIFPICILFNLIQSHIEMMEPAPRKSKYNQDYYSKQNVDYDMTSPLGSKSGFSYPFPCRTASNEMNQDFPIYKTYKAGSQMNIKLNGGAFHEGGHCEFSISYDKGKTFIVLKTLIGNCLTHQNLDYSVDLSPNLPAGNAVFAWTWINRTGNREFYMNCADINIQNDLPQDSWLLEGPKMFVGNLPGYPIISEFGSNDYVTGANYYQNRTILKVRTPNHPIYPKPDPIIPPTPILPIIPVVPKPDPIITPSPILPIYPVIPKPIVPVKPVKPEPINPNVCEAGALKCNDESFETCVFGKWVSRECASGTKCQEINNFAFCI